ncbi:MAG: LLM class flavin-dependent oxidoreductase, partial [Armatimonadetes bacterium]|nr:LLM class flavin-dependent oxidoreductase [Armatimonadota bacterium]
MTLRFGLRLPPCAPPQVIAAEAARAEQAGFDCAWIPDSQLLWRDVWVTLSAAALATSRIALGTNVTNPLTRHPTVTACAAASLDELSGGRAIVGIGPGESSVRVMGWNPAKVAAMKEAI